MRRVIWPLLAVLVAVVVGVFWADEPASDDAIDLSRPDAHTARVPMDLDATSRTATPVVVPAGGAPASGDADALAQHETPDDATTRAATTLAGVVVDEHDAPVPRADVLAWRDAGLRTSRERPEPDARATCDDEGRFALELASDAMCLVAAAPGFVEGACLSGEIPAGGRVDGLRLVITRPVAIAGRVVDEDGLPVADATVRVSALVFLDRTRLGTALLRTGPPAEERTTDADGRFVVDAIADTRLHDVEARHPAYPVAHVTLESVDEPVLVVLTRGESLEGRVLGPSGLGVPGARVRAFQPHGAPREAVTSDGGSFTLDALGDGETYLLVSAEGLALLGAEPIEVPHRGRVELRLEPERVLAGRVESADGAPLAGVALELEGDRLMRDVTVVPPRTWERVAGLSRTTSDADGRFAFARLYAGTFRVTARDPQHPEQQTTIETPSGVDDLRLVLDGTSAPRATVTGTVRDAVSGAPLDVFDVSIMRPTGGGGAVGPSHSFSDAAGRFTVDDVESGVGFVRASAPEHLPRALAPVTFESGVTVECDIALDPLAAPLAVRVVDAAGRPVVDARVQVVDPDAQPGSPKPIEAVLWSTSSDDEGRATFEVLPARRARLDVRADGVPASATYSLPLDLTLPQPDELLVVVPDGDLPDAWRELAVGVFATDAPLELDPLVPETERERVRGLLLGGALHPPQGTVLLVLRVAGQHPRIVRLWRGDDGWTSDGDAETPNAQQPAVRLFASREAQDLEVEADGCLPRTIAFPAATPGATGALNVIAVLERE
ncbi:MAG: carboxypeptidase regulatory-like domain-containing protein [Planctomycetes bacterium]|nr:carboxypeptidase regulatory-like domain-containing protein [Planctomycetota bacterium]